MPLLTYVLTFNEPINVSVQVGDMLYYANTNTVAAGSDSWDFGGLGGVTQFGVIQQMTNQYGEFITDALGNIIPITITVTSTLSPPTASDFILFGKDKTINTSSLIGYYAKVNFVNNSTEKAELFSVGSEVFESSK